MTREKQNAKGLVVLCLIAIASCGPKLPVLPSGPGAPFAEFASAYAEATEHCRGVRTLSAALALSGRAGRTKLRGRLDAGFAAPAQLRLEGYGPLAFGRPVFVLVARGEDATLVLNRDRRVLRGEPEAIIEALAGVALAPDELRAAIAGCGLGPGEPTMGQAYPHGWVSLDTSGATAWLRQNAGRWRLLASARGPIEIRYDDFTSDRPNRIRIRTAANSSAATDLTIRLSQVEINVDLGPEVFQPDVPADATPLTLDELRRAGPFGTGSEPGLEDRSAALAVPSR